MEIKKINYIEKFRRERGLTQSQFAKEIGVVQSTISKIERGATKPNYGILRKLAKTYKVNLKTMIESGGLERTYDLPIKSKKNFKRRPPRKGLRTRKRDIPFCNTCKAPTRDTCICNTEDFGIKTRVSTIGKLKEQLDSYSDETPLKIEFRTNMIFNYKGELQSCDYHEGYIGFASMDIGNEEDNFPECMSLIVSERRGVKGSIQAVEPVGT